MRCLKFNCFDLGVCAEINLSHDGGHYVVTGDGEEVDLCDTLEDARRVVKEWFEELMT
ncbi:hypothetical protein BLL52_4098 [Rhodoferax antarcticus ANT.BR]|uniref:Uncharacterized protein n=1 Tax=Rhodoferax antarcticus ANT.BR TaxID=1111071 RepID=A0A1Q8Y974_9BURK|nr:hypothetical protein BLL52_4098 [Rhodoferax antarcticus ANT.BR]